MDDGRQRKRMPWIDGCVKNALTGWLRPNCLLCGDAAPRGALCAGCVADLPVVQDPCSRCGCEGGGPGCCGRCQQQPPAYDELIAPYRYDWPLDPLIRRLKYRGHITYARPLGELLAGAVANGLRRRPDVIIPVPLHPRRLRRRGFNQALEIARPVARRLGVRIARDAAHRRRHTRPQAELAGQARHSNVHDAFASRPGLHASSAALVDDVMTSGETVEALTRCLRAAGVEHIQVWVLTRA